MPVILGIDLGTSSIKAMLFDPEQGVLMVRAREHQVMISAPGYAEQDPEVWWEGTKEVLRKLKEADAGAFGRIKAIGFSGQMHGLVLVDEAGRALRPAILWLDQRAKDELSLIEEKIKQERMGEIFRNRVFTGFAFPSLLWVKEREPQVFSRIHKLMLPKDYIRLKITGEFGSDVSDASSTAMFATKERTWAKEVLGEFSLPEKIFPSCGESTEIAGYVTRACARETGLPEGIPAVYGSGDQQAQSIGNGVCEEGTVISNIGTGGQISVFSAKPVYDKALRTHTFCHGVPGGYTVFGASLCSGMSLNWLKNKILQAASYQDLSAGAKAVPPGSEGLLYLPYLSGERTPHMNPQARGLFFGLTLSHDRRHMARAVMEGVTYSLKDSLKIIEGLGLVGDTVIASGGGAASSVWLRIQADILEKPVRVCAVAEQACLGACLLAGYGTGIFKDLLEACRRYVKQQDRIYEPNPENQKVYQEGYHTFQMLYSRTADLM